MRSCCAKALSSGAAVKIVNGGTNRDALLTAIADSDRFGNVLISDYTDITDAGRNLQFAALTFTAPDLVPLIAFRGTDDSLAGWKEDFMISFTETESQRMACSYLRHALEACGAVEIAGHSKGGNLAWYAASRLSPAEQERLKRIWLHDSPGLCPEALDISGVAAIRQKAVSIRPVYSVIGRIFEASASESHIVRANAMGILQHDLACWGIDHGRLDEAPAFDPGSDWIHAVISQWLEAVPLGEREQFVRQLFSSLESTGVQGLQELAARKLGGLESALAAVAGIDPSAVRTAAKLVPAVLVSGDAEISAEAKKAAVTWRDKLQDARWQALVLGTAGAAFLLLSDLFLTVALLIGLFAIALFEAVVTWRRLKACSWDFRKERVRVNICFILLAIDTVILLKDQAAFILGSSLFGVFSLVLAYHHVIRMKESGFAPLHRLRDLIPAILYTLGGLYAFIMPEAGIRVYSLAIGILLLLDSVGTITAWLLHDLKRKKRGIPG